jgi:hypothetical protein
MSTLANRLTDAPLDDQLSAFAEGVRAGVAGSADVEDAEA